MDPAYLYWPISDGTQKLTLYLCGHGAYWAGLYTYACEHAIQTDSNQRMCFESHRAAIDTPANREYPVNPALSRKALAHMEKQLPQLAGDFNFPFYHITYFTQYIGFLTIQKAMIDEAILRQGLASFHALLESPQTELNLQEDNSPYLFGSWQQLNETRSKHSQTTVGANNFILALVDAGHYETALVCYEKAMQCGNNRGTPYLRSKIAFAEECIGRKFSE